MGWRLRKSFRLAKGVRLTVGTKGMSVSAGVKGFRVGVSSTRGPYTSTSIPGTGLYRIDYLGRGKGATLTAQAPPAVPGPSSLAPPALPGSGLIGGGLFLLVLGALIAIGSLWVGLGVSATGLVLVLSGYRTPGRERAQQRVEASAKAQSAEALRAQGRLADALADARGAAGLWPESGAVRFVLGRALAESGEHQEALAHLEEAVRLGETDPLLPLLLAHSYLRVGNHESAIGLLQHLPADHPYYLPGLTLLAVCLMELRRYEAAVEVLKRAPLSRRKLDDTLLQVHYLLAECYAELHDKQRALRHLRRVYATDAIYRDVAARIATLEQ